MWLFLWLFWLYCVALQRGRQEQQDINNKDGKTRAMLDYIFLDLATFQNLSVTEVIIKLVAKLVN